MIESQQSGSSYTPLGDFQLFLCLRSIQLSTYDHRSVRTGHPVQNHEVSIVFVVPGTKILEKKVL